MRILVLDGGGQLGTFTWGVLSQLHSLNIAPDFFDYYICTSAGAFNASYFITGQIEEGKRIWLEYLPKLFWQPFRNDLNALKDILTTIEPLNTSSLKNTLQNVLVTLTNKTNGKLEYAKLNGSDRIIETLLTSCSMPYFSGSQRFNNAEYYDGGLIAQLPIAKALEISKSKENTEIWVICNQPVGYRLNELTWKIASLFFVFDKQTRRLISDYPKAHNKCMSLIESTKNLKVIRPKSYLPIGLRSKNRKLIHESFILGTIAANEFINSYAN